jgi:hypothetical protein
MVETVLRGKCLALAVYVRKGEESKINNLSFYPRKVEKELDKLY